MCTQAVRFNLFSFFCKMGNGSLKIHTYNTPGVRVSCRFVCCTDILHWLTLHMHIYFFHSEGIRKYSVQFFWSSTRTSCENCFRSLLRSSGARALTGFLPPCFQFTVFSSWKFLYVILRSTVWYMLS